MKTFFSLIIYSTLCLNIFSSCRYYDHDISIQVKNTEDKYEFAAYYPVEKTGDVQDYVNESIEPNSLYKSSHDYFNVYTELKDGTHFHIKSSPGKMEIELYKNENSPESYNRIKKMCEGIKNILTEK